MSEWTTSGGGFTVEDSGYTEDAADRARLQALEEALGNVAQALAPFLPTKDGSDD